MSDKEIHELVLVKRTRREVLSHFCAKMNVLFEAVKMAQNELDVHSALDDLQNYARNNVQTVNLSELVGINKDIIGTIESIKQHDSCREALNALREILNKRVQEELAVEAKKEKANKLRNIFEQLAKHADDLVDLIDVHSI